MKHIITEILYYTNLRSTSTCALRVYW